MNNKKEKDINNKSKSYDNRTNYSLDSHKDKKYDTIPFRIGFIKSLLGNKKLRPMVNFDSCETENFIGPVSYQEDGYNDAMGYNRYNSESNSNGSSKSSNDTRHMLNKKVHDFYKVINQIGGKLLYIKSGTTGHTFKGIVTTENGTNVNYAVKVVAYPKRERYGDLHNVDRPENAELMMIRTLSYFVVKQQTPHIVLPMGTFNTEIRPFLNLIRDNIVDKDNKKYREFLKKYKKGQYYNYVSILISEWANRGDLLDFIRKNYREFKPIDWKVFFFQIISVLAVIQSKFPSFRHNDLKANNILVHKVSQRGKRFSYTVNRVRYIVPSIGYQIKLWDFDFACIPGVVNNTKVSAKWTNDINVKPSQNRYYDLHYFFNTLIKRGFFPQFMEESCIPQEAKNFVNRIVPPNFQKGKYVAERGRILVDDEYKIPNDVLKLDPYFEEFRNPIKKRIKKSSNGYKWKNNVKSKANYDYSKNVYDDYIKNSKKYYLNSS